jgi:DUF971 family protein
VATDPRYRCKAVRSPKGARTTEIEWGDGHRSIHPHDILRGYCPCAGCQGHSGAIAFKKPEDFMLEIEAIEPVGNYALQLTWFDGHSSGIYSYRYLRALCQCEACRVDSPTEGHLEMPRL